MKKIVWGTLVIFMLLLIISCIAKKNKSNIEKNYKYFFLGDSHFEFFDTEALIPSQDICNLGIRGETTGQILKRLKSRQHLDSDYFFLIGGTNDILLDVQSSETINNLRNIIKHMKENGAVPIIHTLPYVSSVIVNAQDVNLRISHLNEQIKKLAAGQNCDLIDLNTITSENGFLIPELTSDGFHFNENGYKLWSVSINNYLNSIQ